MSWKSSVLRRETTERGSQAEDWARNLRPRKEVRRSPESNSGACGEPLVRPEFNSGDDPLPAADRWSIIDNCKKTWLDLEFYVI